VVLLRRALVAVSLMAAAGSALRFGSTRTTPRRVGGWRALSGPSFR
jgi:hypothetical protein